MTDTTDSIPRQSTTTAAQGSPAHSLLAMSRRTLLQRMFLGLGVVGSPALLTACGGSSSFGSTDDTPVGGDPTPPAEPPVGGPELTLPTGPLAGIGPVEPKTMSSGGIDGIDEEMVAPAGFDVRVVARNGLNPLSGQPDATGFEWHVNPDGGAVFPSPLDGGWVYVSNSETTPGGVGALRFDADGNLIDAYRILDGTTNNCAGGATPWGTWLSCEETTGGEVYECNPFGTVDDAVVRPALGAFPHEAVAIDPINHVAYLTEDGGDQRFYRFVSNPGDLTTLADGTVRMGLTDGTLEVLNITGFENGGDPASEDVREAVAVTWTEVGTSGGVLGVGGTANGTQFNGGEGIWYYEVPEGLRAIPDAGTVPTRGVIFFATKGDNRVWAFDVANQLIELIFDNDNMQVETGFNDVDNVTVSPAGDVLVAEDGDLMRLYVIVPNEPAKLLMQINKGGSEITGPAFTADGSRLYFSSQRGPSGVDGTGSGGATYEMTIPAEFRG